MSLPLFTHLWSGDNNVLLLREFLGTFEGIQILSSRMIPKLSWDHRLKCQLCALSVLLRLRWACWHVAQMGLRKLKSYMVCINTKCPGQECGFCGIFWLFFFQGGILYGDEVHANLSSHAPLESKYLMLVINCNLSWDSLGKGLYIQTLKVRVGKTFLAQLSYFTETSTTSFPNDHFYCMVSPVQF